MVSSFRLYQDLGYRKPNVFDYRTMNSVRLNFKSIASNHRKSVLKINED